MRAPHRRWHATLLLSAQAPHERTRRRRASIVLVAALLVGAGAATRPAAAQPQPSLGSLKVVLLGDSYAAGNGARNDDGGRNYWMEGCYRSPTNWAEQYVRSLTADRFDVTFVNRACSGGVAAEILNPRNMGRVTSFSRSRCEPTYPDEEYYTDVERDLLFRWHCTRWLRPQIEAVGEDTDLVLLSIGGNDASFATIVQQCFVGGFRDPGDCREAVENAEDLLPDIRARIVDVLNHLRARMRPDAKVVLVGYPYLEIDPDYELVWAPLGFERDRYAAGREVRRLGDLGDDMHRGAIAAANGAAGDDFALFVEGVKERFSGHEPSANGTNPDRWLYEAYETRIAAEWYHYNPQGHREIARELATPLASTVETLAQAFIGLSSVDLVFVVDTTGSMFFDIEAVKQFSTSLVSLMASRTASY